RRSQRDHRRDRVRVRRGGGRDLPRPSPGRWSRESVDDRRKRPVRGAGGGGAMSTLEAEVWTDWNQRRLVEAVDRIRRSLERHAGVGADPATASAEVEWDGLSVSRVAGDAAPAAV